MAKLQICIQEMIGLCLGRVKWHPDCDRSQQANDGIVHGHKPRPHILLANINLFTTPYIETTKWKSLPSPCRNDQPEDSDIHIYGRQDLVAHI
jgi:hypothetical protein